MRPLLFILMLIFVASCANTAETTGSNEALDGEFIVTGLRGNDFSSEELMLHFNPIGNTISGNTGCNQFSATFHQEGKEVVFTTPISTRIYCEGKMETEKLILLSFEKVSKFVRTGNDFVFYSEENQPVITLTKSN